MNKITSEKGDGTLQTQQDKTPSTVLLGTSVGGFGSFVLGGCGGCGGSAVWVPPGWYWCTHASTATQSPYYGRFGRGLVRSCAFVPHQGTRKSRLVVKTSCQKGCVRRVQQGPGQEQNTHTHKKKSKQKRGGGVSARRLNVSYSDRQYCTVVTIIIIIQ